MRRQLTRLLATLLATGLLVSCGDDGDDTTTADGAGSSDDGSADSGDPDDGGLGDLDGREFLSQSVTEDGQDRPLVDGTQIRLSFENGEVRANAGCNHLFAEGELDGDHLVVQGMGGTEMGCDPELHDQDEWLIDLLSSEPTVSLDGDTLTITGDATVIELLDREVAQPDQDLEGPTWELSGMINGETASSTPNGAVATIEFADQQVTVQVEGCNSGSAPAEVSDDGSTEPEILFGDLVMTRMACPDPQTEVETALVNVLHDSVTYEIEASSLTLMQPDGQGLTFEAR